MNLVDVANEYLYLIISVVVLIGAFAEMRFKLQSMGAHLDRINGKVTRHENWIHRAIGRWGGPDYENHGR